MKIVIHFVMAVQITLICQGLFETIAKDNEFGLVLILGNAFGLMLNIFTLKRINKQENGK